MYTYLFICYLRGREGDLKLIRAEDETSLASILRNADSDYIVLDGAPRITKTTKQILAVSDVVLVPVSTAGADVWATFDTEDAIKEEIADRKDLKVRLLMNRYRDYVNSAKTIKSDVKKEFEVGVMNSTLGYREAYAQALAQGYCFLTLANVNLRSFYLPMWDSPLLTPIRVKPVQTAAFV